MTTQAGIDGPRDDGQAAAFADVDGDGFVDLYMTVADDPNRPVSADFFYHNNHAGAFLLEALTRGIEDVDGGSHGAVWADLDNDGDYDLVNASIYTDSGRAGGIPASNNIYRNDGAGYFTEETAVDVAGTARRSLSAVGRQYGRGLDPLRLRPLRDRLQHGPQRRCSRRQPRRSKWRMPT